MLFRTVLLLLAATLCYAGVRDRIKENLNDYHKVQVTLPSRPSAKGILQAIQNAVGTRHFTIRTPPLPFVSSLWRNRNDTNVNNTKSSEVIEVTSSPAAPVKASGSANDWCGSNILVDLTSRKEVTYKSTKFPSGHSVPYACSWDVKVSKNCRRGKITMKLDERSRLAQEDRCAKGYFRVAPYMKEAKICGRIGTVPAYQWYVDQDQQPEEVTIIMKNIGLNDGLPEGISFSLKGECVSGTDKSDVTIENVELSSRWMNQVLLDSSSTVGGRTSEVTLFTASMSFQPISKLSAIASEKISQDLIQAEEPVVPVKKPTSITFYSPLYLLFRKLKII